MHTLFTHASCLIGLLVFMKQAWGYAPLDRAVLLALGTGLTVYLLLVFGTALVQRIMAYDPPGNGEGNDASNAETTDANNSNEANPASQGKNQNTTADEKARQQQPVASPMV